jgi:hypothetical protein
MTLVAMALVGGCDHPAVAALEPERQQAGCALLAQPTLPLAERPMLEALYAQPGFEQARQRDTGVLAALLTQLRARLLALFETSGAHAYSNVTRVVVLGLALALTLGMALRWRRRRDPLRAVSDERSATRPPLEAPQHHLERARGLLATTPRGALRETLLALLVWLEREHLARPDRSLTNLELVAQLPARGASAALTARVGVLASTYDRTFYSLEPVSIEVASAFLAAVEPLVAPSRGA